MPLPSCQRVLSQKRRLIAGGVDEKKLDKMTTVEIRALLKETAKKTAKAKAKTKTKAKAKTVTKVKAATKAKSAATSKTTKPKKA